MTEKDEFQLMSQKDWLRAVRPYEGLICLLWKNPSQMNRCWYVISQREIPEEVIDNADVHGWVTYNEFKDWQYIVGFDCAHWWDRTLSLNLPWDVYRDKEYAKGELFRLAEYIHNNLPT